MPITYTHFLGGKRLVAVGNERKLLGFGWPKEF